MPASVPWSLPRVLLALAVATTSAAAAADTARQPRPDAVIAGPAEPIARLLAGEGDPQAAALPPPPVRFDPDAIGLPLRPRRLALDPRPEASPPRPLRRQKAHGQKAHGQAGDGGGQPLFLVGADRVSLAWLAAHGPALRRLGATGLIVQAETADDVRRVRAAASGLPLIAVPGDAIADALGLDRYPAVIADGQVRSRP
jgi:integrating conjugative element protein (TIGR03765 family)